MCVNHLTYLHSRQNTKMVLMNAAYCVRFLPFSVGDLFILQYITALIMLNCKAKKFPDIIEAHEVLIYIPEFMYLGFKLI